MRIWITWICGVLLAGCGHTAYDVRIPLGDSDSGRSTDAAVIIHDARQPGERKTHLGKDIWSCERWFGDDAFQPPKLALLEALMLERLPLGVQVQLRLERFDTVEYCQNTGNSGGVAAARNAGAKGMPDFSAGAVMGDTVRLRLAGAIDGIPFDVTRSFDYGNLAYTSPAAPSSNEHYRALLREALDRMADEIIRKVPRSTAP